MDSQKYCSTHHMLLLKIVFTWQTQCPNNVKEKLHTKVIESILRGCVCFCQCPVTNVLL